MICRLGMLLACCLFASSCATLWPNRIESCDIDLRGGAELYDTTGRAIEIDSNVNGSTAKMLHPRDDVVAIRYGHHSYFVHPSRSLRPLAILDFVGTMGLGSFVDDVTGNDVGYSMITFRPEDTLTLATSLKGAGLFANAHSPVLMIEAELGGVYNFNQTPLFTTPRGSIGLGFGFRKRLELFAQFEGCGLMGLTSDDGKDFTGMLLAPSLRLRLYPYRSLYLGAGVGFVHAYADTLYRPSHELATLPQSYFRDILLSIGYSATWTFCEFELAQSIPGHVRFGDQQIGYSFWMIKFGLNVPL